VVIHQGCQIGNTTRVLFLFLPQNFCGQRKSEARWIIFRLMNPETSPVVRYEFPVASRHKATATRFSTGMARLMFVSCRTKCGPTKLQTNWKVCLEIRKCSCQMLSQPLLKSVPQSKEN